MKLKGKNRENEQYEIIKWIKELRQNSWQTVLGMLRTGSCGNSNGLLSLALSLFCSQNHVLHLPMVPQGSYSSPSL